MSRSIVGGTIKKSIGPYYSDYIAGLINSGKYLTVAEVLRDALRLHENRAKEYRAFREHSDANE